MKKLVCIIMVAIVVSYKSPANYSITIAQDSLMQLAYHFNLPHTDICIINIDGSGDKCINNTNNRVERNPVWSPDGRFLAYRATDEPVGLGRSTAYVYDLEREVAHELPREWYIFDWSPDGAFLLATWFNEGINGIYTFHPDGSNLQALAADDQLSDAVPAWSSDGRQIAYLIGFPEATLMVMDADGENPRALTTDLKVSFEAQPAWSPDSSQIAFVVNGEYIGMDQTREIYVVNADGTNLCRLTDTKGITSNPRWSPDGSQIVFYGHAVGAFDVVSNPTSLLTEVFIINADGSNLVNLTQNVGLDYHPAWSPDGEWIAFASTRKWESEEPRGGIFIMRPDGTDMRMVTNEPPFAEGGREANNPVWRPLAR